MDTRASSAETVPSITGYEVGRKLGSGATGTVYLGRQISTGREVAVKALAPELLAVPGFKERFRAEAKVMTRFDDAHLVDIFDYTEQPGGAFLVMQYVRGVQLRVLIDRGVRFTPEQSLGILSGALSGLAAAHRLGIVHGDLKPENVLVDESGESKLLDFGQSGPTGSRPSGGTPAYASPEAVLGRPTDERSDVYAAGLILYELLAGRPAFRGTATEVARSHAHEQAPDLQGVPGPVADLVARSLSKDPDQRPRTADDFLEQLTEAATRCYGNDWKAKSSIAALAGAAIGAAGGLEATSGTSSTTSTTHIAAGARLRTAARMRRIATRVHRLVGAHPVSTVATVAVVGAAAVTLSLIGSSAPPAGAFSTLSASGSPAGVVCISSSECLVDLGSEILRTGSGGPVALSALPVGSGSVSAVSCGTSRYCVALGTDGSGTAVAFRSRDGGSTWSRVAVPGGTGTPTDVSCVPGSESCWAATKTGLLESDDGAPWTQVATPTVSGPMSVVSCPSRGTCVGIAGGTAESTHDGGSSWRTAQLAGLLYTAAQIDCVNSDVCWAVGEYTNSLQSQIGSIDRTTDGGSSWSQIAFPAKPQPYGFDSVSCWTTDSCLVDGTVEWGGLESSSGSPYFLATSDAGRTWTVHLAPETMPFSPDIQCLSASDCWLSGESGAGISTDEGSTWDVSVYGPKLALSSVSCASPGACVVSGAFPDLQKNHLGAFVEASTNPMGALVDVDSDGRYSNLRSSDTSVSNVTDLSCDPQACESIGVGGNGAPSELLSIGTDGKQLSASSLPGNLQSVSGLSCTSPGECVLTGQLNGQPYLGQRVSGTWRSLRVPSGTQTVGAVDCPNAAECLVVGTDSSGPVVLDGTISGDATVWRRVDLPSDVHSVASVDCPQTRACWVGVTVGANGTKAEVLRSLQVKDAPVTSHWSVEPIPNDVAAVDSLSCPSISSCLAVATQSDGSTELLGAGQVGSAT